MKSWSKWFDEGVRLKRERERRPQGVYMAEDGPISYSEAVDRYGLQVLHSPFTRLTDA